MAWQAYVICVRYDPALPQNTWQPRFENAINQQVGDWLRFNSWTYFVWSPFDATHITNIVRPHIGQAGELAVVKLDLSDHQGWTEKWVWEWFAKRRDSGGQPVPT